MKKLMLGAVGSLFVLSACSEGPVAPAPVEAPEAPAEFGELSDQAFDGTFGLVASGAVVNGGFEDNGGDFSTELDHWEVHTPFGGAVYAQTGTTAPYPEGYDGDRIEIPAPPEGQYAAMTSPESGGIQIWYQDVVIPADGTLSFRLFIGNWFEGDVPVPSWHQFRVDIVTPETDLATFPDQLEENEAVYQVVLDEVLVMSEYEEVSIPLPDDLTPGETMQLRFVQASLGDFAVGIDDVAIVVPGNGPVTRADCMKGGWEAFGFKNQGRCVRFVETGKDSR